MTAAAWNARYPVGTEVDYFPVRGLETCVRARTRTPAWELGVTSRSRRGETETVILVSIEGKSGGVHVSHVWPVVKVAEVAL